MTVAGKPVKLDTADVIGEGNGRRRQPNQEVRFRKLDLGQQLAHTLDTPWVAYFLFVAGFALIIFEFFTAGVGIAGFVGAVALIGACFGFSHLPVQWWAIALLLLGIFGLVDRPAGRRARRVDVHRRRVARRGLDLRCTAARRGSIRRGGSSRSCAAARCCSCSRA